MKQRLVGAAVIVALAVVIIPMLLTGSGNHGVRGIPPAPQAPAASGQGAVHEQNIPLPPGESQSATATDSAPAVTAPEPTQPAAPTAPVSAAAAQPQASTPAAAPDSKAAAPSAPAAAPKPKPAEPAAAPAKAQPAKTQSSKALASWVIQVGSFSEHSKAIALRDRLRKANFPAFVERFVGADKRPMYRVRVGPELDRAKAEAMQKRLQEQQKLKGFVTQHS